MGGRHRRPATFALPLSSAGWTAILLAELVLGFAAAPSALPQGTGQAETMTLSSRNAGNAIRRAAGLLPTRLDITIEVVDLRKLAESLRRQVGKTCAFVINQAPPVYVLSSCPAYQEALSSLFEAMKLAAILRHEVAHLEGADERHARLIEAQVFRELIVRHASESELTEGMRYAADIEKSAAAVEAKGEDAHSVRAPDGAVR